MGQNQLTADQRWPQTYYQLIKDGDKSSISSLKMSKNDLSADQRRAEKQKSYDQRWAVPTESSIMHWHSSIRIFFLNSFDSKCSQITTT